MNTIKELRQALAEEATRLQPPPGLEARILESALQSRAGVGSSTPRSGARGTVRSWDSKSIEPPRLMALVAALLAVAIVAGLVLTARALHTKSSIPANQGPSPLAQPSPYHSEVCRSQCEVAAQSALQPKSEAPRQCVISSANGCEVQPPFFASPTVGWITYSITGPNGPTFLYRTDDAGQHWRPVLSWDGLGVQQILSSADGNEVLVVAAPNGTVFHSTDGGTHWAAYGFPVGLDPTSPPVVAFLNPREGWIAMSDALERMTALLHTTDSGAHWTQIVRLEWGPNGGGHLVLFASSFGIVTKTGTVYLTHDGGTTWGAISAGRPRDLPASAAFFGLGAKSFNSHDGLLVFYYCSKSACGLSPDLAYVYATSDGGRHWSDPARLPAGVATPEERTIFIDPNHWIRTISDYAATGYRVRSVIHTADAGQHWAVLVAPTDPGVADWDQFAGVDFADPLHGWATTLGPNGNIGVSSLRLTSDGGITWTVRPLPDSIVQANTGNS